MVIPTTLEILQACSNNDVRFVQGQLDDGWHPNTPARGCGTRFALHAAAGAGHLQLVRLLLQHGATPTAIEDWFHWSALHAAVSGAALRVRRIADRTFMPTVVTHALLRYSPLRDSTHPLLTLPPLLTVLLDAGADPTIRSHHGHSPLSLARDMGLDDEYVLPLLTVQQGPVSLPWDPTTIPQLGDEEDDEAAESSSTPAPDARAVKRDRSAPTVVVTPPTSSVEPSPARASRQRRKAQMAVGF